MKLSISITLLALSLTTSAFASVEAKNCFPENNLWIAPDAKNISTIDKVAFNKVIDKIEGIYKPIIKEKGGKFVVERKWDDGTVNAYAQRQGTTWMVTMFGGLARHATVTQDAFAFVVCHELGHHLGGAIKIPGSGNTWASNEGQSDYWGSLKCMRRVFEDENNEAIVANMKVPALVAERCAKHFSDNNDIAICKRSAMAGESLASLLAELGSLPKPKFETPSTVVVPKTDHKHPKAQCRLDTYLSGAVCDVNYSEEVDDKDPNVGTCQRGYAVVDGSRPLCWYKPSKKYQ